MQRVICGYCIITAGVCFCAKTNLVLRGGGDGGGVLWVRKGVCYTAGWPEFNPWDPHSGRKEPMPGSCPLISISYDMYTYAHALSKC